MTSPVRVPAVVLSVLLSAAVPSAAQDAPAASASKSVCFHAKPKPTCSAFWLTNFGTSVVVAGGVKDESRLRFVADWGYMANVSTRAAIGASVFLSLDDAGVAVGPAARYRRWMSRTSFEIGVGTPVVGGDDIGDMWPGSILGLVRWSPELWLSVTARPELLRRRLYVGPSSDNVDAILWRGRASIGVEAGEVPGLVLTAAGGALLVFLLLTTPGT